MNQRVIKIGCGYDKDELYVFPLRVISLAEENQFQSRFAEIADNESSEKKAELTYEIMKDALASWCAESPILKKDGKETSLVEDADTPANAVRTFFETRTAEKERIAHLVIWNFRNHLAPTVVFL